MFTFIPIVLALSSLAFTSASPLVVRDVGTGCVPNPGGNGVQINPKGTELSLVPTLLGFLGGGIESLNPTTSTVAQFTMRPVGDRFFLLESGDNNRAVGFINTNMTTVKPFDPSDTTQQFSINCVEGCGNTLNNGDAIGKSCFFGAVGQGPELCLDSTPLDLTSTTPGSTGIGVTPCNPNSGTQEFDLIVRTT